MRDLFALHILVKERDRALHHRAPVVEQIVIVAVIVVVFHRLSRRLHRSIETLGKLDRHIDVVGAVM